MASKRSTRFHRECRTLLDSLPVERPLIHRLRHVVRTTRNIGVRNYCVALLIAEATKQPNPDDRSK